ncbi:hypothetical protein SCLCIDRAFT_116543, partial [Scleroderma citrinum Foug A]
DAIFLGEALTKHMTAADSTGPLSDADTILASFVTERRSHALEPGYRSHSRNACPQLLPGGFLSVR